jgi:putative oxidoreductase
MKLLDTVLRPLALTTLRVAVGVIMVTHGWLKLADMRAWTGTVEGLGIPWPEGMAWLSMAAEFFGGMLLVVGLLTPLMGLVIFANLMVAIFTVHRGQGLLAAEGGFELPLTLGLVALYFVFRGGGPISLDAVFLRRRAARRAEPKAAPEPSRPEAREPPMKPAEAPG